jgi:hypothetical protein
LITLLASASPYGGGETDALLTVGACGSPSKRAAGS